MGLTALGIGILTLIIAMISNPWFNPFKGALSDMGRIGLKTAWIFNTGLLISSIVASLYTVCLLMSFRHPAMHLAAGIYLVSVGHLFLIALFPEGTRPHEFISYEFFLMMFVTYLTYTVSLWLERLKMHSLLSFLAFVLGFSLSASLKWPSTAILELFNISIMGYWFGVMFYATGHLMKPSM